MKEKDYAYSIPTEIYLPRKESDSPGFIEKLKRLLAGLRLPGRRYPPNVNIEVPPDSTPKTIK